jgi:peptidoglycan/LPS O-acetylase OafA/YrhL
MDDGRSPAGRWPALDGLRGLAVLAVMLYHARVPFARGGHVGVDVFFVLSGFLITTLLLRELDSGRVDFMAFYVRRALRLLPALLVFVIVSCLVVVVIGPSVYTEPTVRGAPFVLAYLANVHQALGWNGGRLGMFDATWSLAMEEQFYLVWPAVLTGLVALARRRRDHAAAALLALALVTGLYRLWAVSSGVGWERLYYGPDARADGLLAGCALALFLASPAARSPRWLPAAGAGSLGLLAFAASRYPTDDPFLYWDLGFTVVALAAALLVWTAISRSVPFLEAVLCWRPLRATGQISYGLYLWHFLIVFSFGAAGAWAWPWWVAAPLLIGLSYAAAALSFALVERRFLRLKRDWAPGRGSGSADPSTVAPAGG